MPVDLHYDAFQKISRATSDALLLGYRPHSKALGIVLLGVLQIDQQLVIYTCGSEARIRSLQGTHI